MRPLTSWRAALAGAAAVTAAGSLGDVWILAALLAALAGEAPAALAAGLAAIAVVWRAGSSSLTALAGAQAVLGPGGLVGPPAAAASSWLAAAGLILAAPPGWLSIAFGLAAADLVAGPAPRTPGDAAVRVGAAVVGVLLAAARGRWLERWIGWAGVVAGVVAVGVEFPVGRGWAWTGAVDLAAYRRGASVAVAVIGLVMVAGRLLEAWPRSNHPG